MNESNIELKEQAPKPRTPKMSAEKALPQSSAEVLIKIIKGYAVASNGGETQINYKDVASAANLNPTVVSRNNSFLLESQFLASPKYGYYVPSEGSVRFARESAWDEGGAKAHLRKIVLDCWFGQVLIQNLSLNSTLTREHLKRTFAIKCGATEGDSSALDFLIDFVIYTGLVDVNENGALTKGKFDSETNYNSPMPEQQVLPSAATITQAGKMATNTIASSNTNPSLIVHVHIKNFDDLTQENAERLKSWMDSLRKLNLPPEIQIETT